jgi:AraC-like DNA-binding protein
MKKDQLMEFSEGFYSYPQVTEPDKQWGAYIVTAGCTRIPEGVAYPPKKHPEGHDFLWEKGRTLNEFVIIYITRGKGRFESSSAGLISVKPGNVILLFPGEWHRYEPDIRTGWDEYWVGADGNWIKQQIEQATFFNPQNPVINVGFNPELIKIFNNIFQYIKGFEMGNQQAAFGELIHLMGNIHLASKIKPIPDKSVKSLIERAKCLMIASVKKTYSPPEIAGQLNMSYINFRKIFKHHTGFSPGQYQIMNKISKAKEMLSSDDKSIKEIGHALGFNSEFYFSRLFKEKTGFAPKEYRLKQI